MREVCAKCLKNGFQRSDCGYCGASLATRHEHDHMPVPLRAGGVDCIPVCINCHDLKDRMRPYDWDQEAFAKALIEAPPLAKIAIALLLGEMHTLKAKLDAVK
jgi:hypothetical protein